jgi:hypothetical protein
MTYSFLTLERGTLLKSFRVFTFFKESLYKSPKGFLEIGHLRGLEF